MSWLRRRRRRLSRSVNKIKLIESRRCTSEEKNYLRFLSNIWYPFSKCRQFVREIYDGQLFVKLKGGSHFPGLDPWVLYRVYIRFVQFCSSRSLSQAHIFDPEFSLLSEMLVIRRGQVIHMWSCVSEIVKLRARPYGGDFYLDSTNPLLLLFLLTMWERKFPALNFMLEFLHWKNFHFPLFLQLQFNHVFLLKREI